MLVLAGRVHLYEGHDVHQVCHGVRMAAAAGVRAAVLTNAAGGIDPDYRVGSLVRITDHLNLSGANPLTGPHDGPQPGFVDLSAAYDPGLRAVAARRRPGHGRGRVRRPGRPQLRDPGRDPHAGGHGRRPGGDVHHLRDHRPAPARGAGGRVQPGHQPGGRAGRAALARGGHRRGPGRGHRRGRLPAGLRARRAARGEVA